MSNIKITLAVHWEGRHLDGVGALTEARRRLLPGVPVTHFVSAAYFARGGDLEAIVDAMLPAIEGHDELALHVPAWQSLRGSSQVMPHSIIEGEDPELSVEYPGITAQVDRGYTLPIGTLPRATIEAFIVSSRLLLRPLLRAAVVRRKLAVERVLRGIRAGHGMASDAFLAAACSTGFTYDASGMDAVWARSMAERRSAEPSRRDPFAPLWRSWARLWGPETSDDPQLDNHGQRLGTGGAGVTATTLPFFVARHGDARLLEVPLNGGVLPPASAQHVGGLLAHALDGPPGLPRILSLAIRQETAEGSLDELLKLEALRSSRIQWTTNVDLADALMGLRPVPAPARSGPLQQVREQMAAAGRMPMPAPMPVPTATAAPAAVVIPSIQIPKIQL